MIPENFGIRPDPSKDQHFLTDEDTIKSIVDLASPRSDDIIFEVGAGIGTLTVPLSKTKARIIAVEIDKKLGRVLEKAKRRNVDIIYDNVLKIIDNVKFNKIVSNTPYSICEPLLNKLFNRKFDIAVMSVPSKFYDAISANPEENRYSLMSLKYQSFFEISFRFKIAKELFTPEPRTETIVMTLKPLTEKFYSKNFKKYVLREIILQKKKKVKNSLTEAIINYNKKILGNDFTKKMGKEIIEKMKVSEKILTKKSEELTLNDFEIILKKLHASHKGF
ncbi:MAG: hypothetical protein KAS04_07355 [Candidatus Aenigmarchaeota archaeon]|nr:hypothetical protein [Candidatus Aenigmarchaeota archaeon]